MDNLNISLNHISLMENLLLENKISFDWSFHKPNLEYIEDFEITSYFLNIDNIEKNASLTFLFDLEKFSFYLTADSGYYTIGKKMNLLSSNDIFENFLKIVTSLIF